MALLIHTHIGFYPYHIVSSLPLIQVENNYVSFGILQTKIVRRCFNLFVSLVWVFVQVGISILLTFLLLTFVRYCPLLQLNCNSIRFMSIELEYQQHITLSCELLFSLCLYSLNSNASTFICIVWALNQIKCSYFCTLADFTKRNQSNYLILL